MAIRSYHRDQEAMFPEDIRSYLGDDHLSLYICEILDCIDMRPFYAHISDQGPPRYAPIMMLSILVYSYCIGVYSSRAIAESLKTDLAFIYLSGKQKPDFRTKNRFRLDNTKLFRQLFIEVVQYCSDLGMVPLDHVAVDGTKIHANASNDTTYTIDRIEEEIEKILEQVSAIDELEDEIYGEDNSGSGVPIEARKRLEKREQIKRKLEQEQNEQKKSNKKGKIKVNATDSDAKFMKMYRRGIHIGYNVQAAVDGKYQIIVAADVVNAQNDDNQLIPMLLRTRYNIGRFPEILTADGGYGNGYNLEFLDYFKIDGYVKPTGYKKEKSDFDNRNFYYEDKRDSYICPAGKELSLFRQRRKNRKLVRVYRCNSCSECEYFGECTSSKTGRTVSVDQYGKYRTAMEEKLDSDVGKQIYNQRAPTVESVFGNIKWNFNFDRFSLRGLDKVNGEFNLVAIAHNIRKARKYLTEIDPIIPNSGLFFNFLDNLLFYLRQPVALFAD